MCAFLRQGDRRRPNPAPGRQPREGSPLSSCAREMCWVFGSCWGAGVAAFSTSAAPVREVNVVYTRYSSSVSRISFTCLFRPPCLVLLLRSFFFLLFFFCTYPYEYHTCLLLLLFVHILRLLRLEKIEKSGGGGGKWENSKLTLLIILY